MSPQQHVNITLSERWISTLGGIALLGWAMRRESGGRLQALFGAELIRRGVTGHCYGYEFLAVPPYKTTEGKSVSVPYALGEHVRAVVTIAKSRSQIYQFWRNFENLPGVMKNLISVKMDGGHRSHWIAQGMNGKPLEWDAEIHNEIPDELIAWRSLPGSSVQIAGSVNLKDAPGGQGTEVLVHLKYNLPAGLIGATFAKLSANGPASAIEAGLLRLKQQLEAGEIATTGGQPHGNGAAPGRSLAEEVLA